MKAKSGKASKLVPPADPVKPEAADTADPGQMAKLKAEQVQQGKGKYGATKVKPYKPAQGDDDGEAGGAEAQQEDEQGQELAWIEIELVGEDDKPIPGEKYRVTLPDGSVDEGTLDPKGWARVDRFEEGECRISFPNLDESAWEFIESVEQKGAE